LVQGFKRAGTPANKQNKAREAQESISPSEVSVGFTAKQ
jgi:hypothetical protein